MAEPPQEAIEQCTLLTGCNEKQAIEFLKRYDNDANRAINAFLDNPEVITLGDHTIGTTIDDGLNYERQTAGLSPPARPPSRSQDASSEGEKFANIAEYLGSTEPLGPQQNGTISANGGPIGPATKEEYDERSWAVTLFNHKKREVQPDADPERRKREQGQPAFLRVSQEAHYLPGFLTILQNIPEVKETMLLKGRVLDDYGSDKEWWNGRAINLPQEVSMDAEQRQYFGILTEVQRLMAFLDGTKRAYGSADHLADLASTSCSSPEETLDKFMTLWQEAVSTIESGANFSKLFQSFCMKVSRSSTGVEESGSGEPFRLIDAYCYPDRQNDLYDALDEAIWPDHDKKALDDIWLETVSPVLPIKVSSILPNYNDVTIKIPFVLYVDRYLVERMEWAKTMRKMRLEVEEEREELEKQISRYEETGSPTTKAILEKAKQAAELLLEDCWTTGLIEDKDREAHAKTCHGKVRNLTTTINSIIPQIDEKISTLKSRKAALVESLNSETRKFTAKTDDPETSAHHEYTLRGFCTSPHVIYLHRLATEDSDSSKAYVDTTTGEKRQWWRITYSVEEAVSGPVSRATPPADTDYAGYSATKMSLDDIEKFMSNDGRSALFIYVDQKALADLPKSDFTEGTDADGLPGPLKKFVDLDNEAFENECRQFDEELASRREALDQRYSNMSELEGREVPLNPLHNPQAPPPVPPRTGRSSSVPKKEEGENDQGRESDKSDDSQTITIEVETEEGKWNKMKFPSSSSAGWHEKATTESQQAANQPQVQPEDTSASSLVDQVQENPEVQHLEQVKEVRESEPDDKNDDVAASPMSMDGDHMAKGD